MSKLKRLLITVGVLALILILGALSPAIAHADGLVVHGFSKHRGTDPTKSYNNSNGGLGYRSDSGLILGVYHNSYHEVTAYVGYERMAWKYVGGFIALGTGYKSVSKYPVAVLGGLLVRLPLPAVNNVTLDLRYLPRIKDNPEVLHVGIGLDF